MAVIEEVEEEPLLYHGKRAEETILEEEDCRGKYEREEKEKIRLIGPLWLYSFCTAQ